MDDNFIKKKKEVNTSLLHIILKRFKKVRLTSLLLLALLMVSSSFAWFIYATQVSNNINAYVKSWKVNFLIDSKLEQEITFIAEAVYPGMETLEQEIVCENSSDVAANLSYEIVEAEILGEKYRVSDGMTSSQLETFLSNKFPFTLTITTPTETLDANNGRANVYASLSWPYESGDDDTDTKWGHDAYIFHEDHPTEPSIKLIIKIIATQTEASSESEPTV